MPINGKYIHDFGIVRQYGEAMYKLTSINCYRQKGFEDDNRKFTAKGEAGNEGKLDNNVSRATSRIFELAYCNPWEWYATLTLDPQKYDRTDLGQYIKDLSQFIRDFRKKTGNKVKYLLIPERHQDGSWHMHGFFMGLPVGELHAFTTTEHLPYHILKRLADGIQVYTWGAYAQRFGYSCMERIQNQEAVSKYITKYITKDTMRTITDLNAHAFYASKGLKSAEIIMQDMLAKAISSPDYANDYIAVKWYTEIQPALAHFEEVKA